jgi:hypothetical protein
MRKLVDDKLLPDLLEDVLWFEKEHAGKSFGKSSPDALATWIQPEKPVFIPGEGEREKYEAEMDKIEGFLATQRPPRRSAMWMRWVSLFRRSVSR